MTADFLLEIFVEVNQQKAKLAIQEYANMSSNPKDSMRDGHPA